MLARIISVCTALLNWTDNMVEFYSLYILRAK